MLTLIENVVLGVHDNRRSNHDVPQWLDAERVCCKKVLQTYIAGVKSESRVRHIGDIREAETLINTRNLLLRPFRVWLF